MREKKKAEEAWFFAGCLLSLGLALVCSTVHLPQHQPLAWAGVGLGEEESVTCRGCPLQKASQ